MIGWYRMAMPACFWVFAFVVALLIIDGFGLGLLWYTHDLEPFDRLRSPTIICGMTGGIVCVAMATLIGGLRASRFPLVQSGFRDWFFLTPWERTQRTPFGPCLPVGLDVIPVGLLSAISFVQFYWFGPLAGMVDTTDVEQSTLWYSRIGAALFPVFTFMLSWVICTLPAILIRRRRIIDVGLFMAGLFFHALNHLSNEVATIIALVMLSLWIAAYRSVALNLLSGIPAISIEAPRPPDFSKKLSQENRFLSPIGYSSDSAGAMDSLRSHATAYSILILLWLTAIPWIREGVALAGLFGLFLPLSYLVGFTERLAPHLGLLARWKLRRLIVPAYDRIFLIPLLMAASSWTCVAAGFLGLLPATLAGSFAVVIPAYIAMSSGRDYQRWSLTAPIHFQSRAAGRNKQKQ